MSRSRTPEKAAGSFLSRITWRSPFWLPVLAIVMVLLALIPGESTPDETVGKPRDVATNLATLACPVHDELSLMVGQIEAGSAAEARSIPAGTLDSAWSNPKIWRTGKVSGDVLVVSQTGEGAGPVGYVAGTARKSIGSGLIVSRCPELLDEGWIVGMADQGKSNITLANLGTAQAVVDVYWYSQIGPVEDTESIGVVIEPGATKTLRIGSSVPTEHVVGAQIVRRRQQVSAIGISADKAGQGTELVLPQIELGRSLVFAGLPDKGTMSVSILNPHEETVRVKLRGIRSGGAFDIEGLTDVAIKPQSTLKIDVPSKAKLNGQAIQAVADQRVAATVTVSTAKDIALLSPAVELKRPSAVPVSLAGKNFTLTVVAPQDGGSVALEGVDANMKVVARKNISVPAGSAMQVDLKKELKGAVAVVLKADGSIFAGAWSRSGDLIGGTPLAPAPVFIQVPAVAVR